MSTKTDIEWTDTTWNPVRGCTMVSAGCANCYAMKFAHRFSGNGKPYEGLTELGPQGPRWTGKIRLVPEALEEPAHWKTPRRIFVNSMSDLFHEDVPDDFIKLVLRVIAASPLHTFQVLTKRPHRMRAFMAGARHCDFLGDSWGRRVRRDYRLADEVLNTPICSLRLANLWLGVSIEDQATADERIPILLQTPAAVRFISAEPLLGPVDVTCIDWAPSLRTDSLRGREHHDDDGGNYTGCPKLDWVIVGGESGPGARPCDLAWIRSLKEQCQTAKVPVFVKQLGTKWAAQMQAGNAVRGFNDPDRSTAHRYDKKGGDMAEWPEDLRMREFPH